MENEIYPLTIIADRHDGAYSGAAFAAWNKAPGEVPGDVDDSDLVSATFWEQISRDKIGFGDTPDEAYQDLCSKMGMKARLSKIKYWICELDMDKEASAAIDRILAEQEMTLDEFFEASVQYAVDNTEEVKKTCEEMRNHPENRLNINIVRYYPVYRGETEAQAKRRALGLERKGDVF